MASMTVMAQDEIPDTLHVGTTGKTVGRTEAAGLPYEEQVTLWYEGKHANGDKFRAFPFYDDTGVSGYGDAATQKPRLSRLQLHELGLTDDELEAVRKEYFGPLPAGATALSESIDETGELREHRRAVFDAVCTMGYQERPLRER